MEDLSQEKKTIKRIQICIFAFVLIGFFVAMVLHASAGGVGDQYRVFFAGGNNAFADLYNVLIYAKDRNPYDISVNPASETAYLPISYVIAYPVARFMRIRDAYQNYGGTLQSLPSVQVVSGMYVVFLFTLPFVFMCARMVKGEKARRLLITAVLMLSGIMIFSYERGNLIILAAAGMMYYLNTYDSEDKKAKELGLLALAFAASMKGYPALLGVLLLYRKDWKSALRLMGYGLAFAFIPFLFLKGGLRNVPIWWSNIKQNTLAYQFIEVPKLGIYYFVSFAKKKDAAWQMAQIGTWKPIIIGLSIWGTLAGYFQKRPWLQIAPVVCMMLIYPPNSALYCMLYMFPVILIYLNDPDVRWWHWIYLPVFVIFLCPYQWVNHKTGDNITLRMMNITLVSFFGMLVVQNTICMIRAIVQKMREPKKLETKES